MKADSMELVDFLAQNKTIFRIPVYQRNYEWGEGQCVQLFKDLENAFKQNKKHFLGAVVYVPEEGPNLSHLETIIDGQQRLTSCMLLLRVLANLNENNKEEIENSFLFNKYIELNNHIKLQPVDKDQEAFQKVINNQADQYEVPSKIIENYNIFKSLVTNSELNIDELFQAINYLNIVYISLDKSENPQVIFESLNSTGVSLSSPDLIRNFILMRLGSNDQTRLYNEYWSKIQAQFVGNVLTEFIRHYLIMRTGRFVNKEKIYDSYKNFYDDQNLTPEEALRDLLTTSNYYRHLLDANKMSKKFDKIVRNINILDKKVVYPYFLKLLDLNAKGLLTWEEIEEIGLVIQSMLYRRMVCGIPSNGLNSLFISLTGKSDSEYELLKARLSNNDFPNDKIFKESLINFPIYNKRRDWAKLTLVVLEENYTKETVDFDDAQVEHIMPQKLSTDWRIQVPNAEAVNKQLGNTIGNLTLTKYNQEMGNKDFNEKKSFYHDSNIYLTRKISETCDTWNKETIISRASELADSLINIFPKLELTPDKQENDSNQEYSISEEVDVTGKKPIRITIQSKDFAVSSWAMCIVVFLNYVWDNDSEIFKMIKNYPTFHNMFSNFRKPKELSNGEMVETSYSANKILALLAKMSEVSGIEDEVSYTIK
ncbi:DUF262 domain-containing protein [Xylocopilactobacillus apicola]|uniref:DUF262 domain-containing protein n=1 Tax=Xylocopilactobacillus apicola TaxID=2932184 RepID=A0AAU9DV21_9LACO|nr:DUF262 domain-containing HNH endonuclease family protein [Xylocopilactobacillus apicola]BDR57708.1 hypothetical protein XA3_01490 [Xylocopilactobacillus apicola]